MNRTLCKKHKIYFCCGHVFSILGTLWSSFLTSLFQQGTWMISLPIFFGSTGYISWICCWLSIYLSYTKSIIFCRPLRHGWTHICARLVRKSRISRKISAMASNSCCCWRSFLARPCKSRTGARWGFIKLPMSTRPLISLPARESNLSPSAQKVKEDQNIK